MTVSLTNHKRLWARSYNTCAFPGCNQFLVEPLESDPADSGTYGEVAHIVPQSDGGPRSPHSLTQEDAERWKPLIDNRDEFANLILLCGTHHTVVDADEVTYSIAALVEMKSDHERLYQQRVSRDELREQEMDLRATAIVDVWASRLDLDALTGELGAISHAKRIDRRWLEGLEALNVWILGRAWPRGYEELREALTIFRLVAQDLVSTVRWYGEEDPRGEYVDIDPAYRSSRFAALENYDFLLARHDYTLDLARDLALALTRATNHVCEVVRELLWPYYRTDQGVTLFDAGLGGDLAFMLIAAHPDGIDRYIDLQSFATDRENFEIHFGAGLPVGFGLPGLESENLA